MDEHLKSVYEHVLDVQRDALRLAERLYKYDAALAETLLSNSLQHDASKFILPERKYLTPWAKLNEPEKFLEALAHHHKFNAHHPEHFSSVNNMPDVFIAEMTIDIKSRSSNNFGDNIWDFFEYDFKNRYEPNDAVVEKIQFYLKLLLRGFHD